MNDTPSVGTEKEIMVPINYPGLLNQSLDCHGQQLCSYKVIDRKAPPFPSNTDPLHSRGAAQLI